MRRDKPRHAVPRASRKRCLAVLLLGTVIPAAATAGDWPDTPLARTKALALLQTLNADLLSHPSATLTLERWCGSHRLATTPTVIARRDRKADKPLPEDLRRALGIDAGTPVRYRRVQLAAGTAYFPRPTTGTCPVASRRP
jgi:hypothetical protein